MKILLIGLLALGSFSTFAKCNYDLINQAEHIVYITNQGMKLTDHHVELWDKNLFHLSDFCRENMRLERLLNTKTNEIFELFLTNDDKCDGTSLYGMAVDQSGEVVMLISEDSFCPTKK